MTACTVYYDPECSKSRALLALLEERAVTARLVDYRRTPLAADELLRLVSLLGDEAPELLRRGDPLFAAADLAERAQDAEGIVSVLQQYPQLMQRPVLVCGESALIARPPERALALL